MLSRKRRFRFAVTGRGETLSEWLDFARKAEDLGYSTLALGDHIDRFMAPLVALVAAAQATTTLRFGAQILVNDFRHPAVVAKEAATADVMTGGRLELGLGAGSTLGDYELAGLPVDPPRIRVERLAESVSILKAFFTQDAVTHKGKHYQIEGLASYPKPAQQPRVPLMIGASGLRTLELAAKEADIISILTGLSAGARSSGRMVDKIARVREVAGQRYEQCEIHTWYTRVQVDGEPEMGSSPLASIEGLIGSRQQVIEQVLRDREENDVSYITVGGSAIDAFAPVVRELAGT
jgi:probable F420-dependent oxidoreductase